MNEVRHVLTGLRTPAKSLSSSSGIASATWYDVPTPIIVHCREFQEEAVGRDVPRNRERSREDETARFVEGNALDREPSLERDTSRVLWSANVGRWEKSDDPATSNPRGGLSDSEATYRSSRAKPPEAAVNGSTRVRVSSESSLEVSLPTESRGVNEERRATTMELNATTTVKTDADGVPTISFSFLRAEENFHENDDEIVILEVDTTADLSGDQSYDLPKSIVLEGNRVSSGRSGNEINEERNSNELPAVRQDLYDVPRRTRKDVSLKESHGEVVAICNLEGEDYRVAVVSPERKEQQRGRMKRSTRSLRSGRRSTSDSDGYDAGIASMSGSYSDPEACPNEEAALSESGGSDRGKRQLRLQKQRLGKAWGRMRSWLRDERTRIGQVVNRHAKLQAVGALTPDVVSVEKEQETRQGEISWRNPSKR